MSSINVNWQTGQVTAPGGTVIDHVDVDLLNSSAQVVQSQPGAPGSGLPSASTFDNVVAGNGYIARARNFDQHGSQIGPDALSNPVDVTAADVNVTVVASGQASVA
jgi:hypothetical protein